MNSKTSPINSKLSGQVAVVTGGGRGIGRAIAATLSEARMTTAVLARSASEIAETARARRENDPDGLPGAGRSLVKVGGT